MLKRARGSITRWARDGPLLSTSLSQVSSQIWKRPAFWLLERAGNLVRRVLAAKRATFEQLLTYVVFIGWIFYGAGRGQPSLFTASAPPEAARPYRVACLFHGHRLSSFSPAMAPRW